MEVAGELVRGVLVPACVVIATPSAEAVCGRNGRRVVDVLRSQNTSRTLAARGPNDRTYAVRDFQLRFAELQDFAPRGHGPSAAATSSTSSPPTSPRPAAAPSPRGAAAENGGSSPNAASTSGRADHSSSELYRMLASSSDDTYAPPLSLKDPADVSSFLRACKGQDVTPWYTQFRWSYLRSIGPAPFEYFDVPVACLFVSATSEENVTKSFLDLYSPSYLPPIFKDGFMDPNLAKFHLLLHDNATDNQPNCEQALTEVRATFGKDCALLRLNSLPNDQAGIGWRLSSEDIKNIQDTIASLSAKTVAQHMQSVIARLHEQVMSNKKGFVTAMALGASSFMGLKFGRSKPAKSTPLPGNSPRPESRAHEITRLLADLEFMIGMYDLALANYKQLASEFKSEKDCGPEYYAAAQEMMGLSTFMSDPSSKGLRRDVEQYLELAWEGYRRAENWSHAVRASIFLAELLNLVSNRQAALTLQRVALAIPDQLCAALLHEQAAFRFLQHSSSSLRQFALELVAAGSKFCEVGQLRHGLRCLFTAYSLYENRGWGSIGDTLHIKLARYAFLLGNHEQCLNFFQKLFSECNQSPPIQNALLREFLHIAAQIEQATSSDLVATRLPVPVVNENSIRLFLASYDPASGGEEEWHPLQERLLHRASVFVSDLSLRPISVIQEYIYIEVEVFNPLQVPIQLTDVQLVCTHVPTEVSDDNHSEAAFLVEPFNCVLRAQEKQKLLLWVVPLAQGQLVIEGIGFKLCGMLWGRSNFVNLCKNFVGGGAKKMRLGNSTAPTSPNGNTIDVVGAMPLIEASFENFPEHILQGEVALSTLHLKNIGHMGLERVSVAMSHPHFFVFGGNNDCTEVEESLPSSNQLQHRGFMSPEIDNIIRLNLIKSLGPDEAISLPIWVRAATTGRTNFRFLFYYQPQMAEGGSAADKAGMAYRLHRLSQSIRVRPSINASTWLRTSAMDLSSQILALSIHNSHDHNSFRLHQVSAISCKWILLALHTSPASTSNSPSDNLDGDKDDNQYLVEPGQTKTLFLRLMPREDQPPNDNTIGTSLNLDEANEIHHNEQPYKSYLRMERARHMAAQMPIGFAGELTPLPRPTLDLLIFWKSTVGSHVHRGHHYVPCLPISHTNVDNFNHSLERPLRFSVVAPREVEHNFATTPCAVPTAIRVKNISGIELNVRLELLRPNQQRRPSPMSIVGSSRQSGNRSRASSLSRHVPMDISVEEDEQHYFWSGSTVQHANQLAVGQEVTFSVIPCFTSPGAYSLEHFQLVVTASGHYAHPYVVTPPQHLIFIKPLKSEEVTLSM